MIIEHSGMAINVAELLHITHEDINDDDHRIIFQFKPTMQYVKNPDTGELELHTVYPTTYQSFVFIEAKEWAYNWWVNAWKEWCEDNGSAMSDKTNNPFNQ